MKGQSFCPARVHNCRAVDPLKESLGVKSARGLTVVDVYTSRAQNPVISSGAP